MADIKCRCGFDLSRLPAKRRVVPDDGGVIRLSCPLCASQLEVHLPELGILVRGSGAKTEFLRWKLSSGQVAGTTVQLGQFQLRFDALGTIEPREICYPKVPVFTGEGGEQIVPALPIRRSYFDCVNFVELERMRRAGQHADVVGGEYQVHLPLNGLPHAVSVRLPLMTHKPVGSPEERSFKDVNLKIWPNLPVAGWKQYLVGLSAVGPASEMLISPSPRARLFARGASSKDWGKRLDSVQRGGDSIVGLIGERPSWIAVEITEPGRAGDDGAEAAAGGLFDVPAVAPKPEGDVQIGLDFGTSNTCVALRGETVPGSEEAPVLLPQVDEKIWNLYLVRGGPEPRSHKGPDLWPSPTGFGPKGDLFASELLFGRPKVDQMRFVESIADWQYGIDFGMPTAGVEPAFSEAEHSLGDFKWREMVAERAPTFARHLSLVQAHYLTAVLMNAYVRAATAHQRAASSVAVTYSYPMSFDSEDMATLKEAAELAQSRLTDATGVEWTLVRGADESVAAAANAGDPGAIVHVFLDMGGGSTDIAVKFERKPGKWETVYLTSVRYAGMSLLAAYEGEGKATTCLAGKTTMDVLRRRVREARGAKDVLGDPTLFSKQQEGVRRNRTVHFYGYLVEYLARLLAAGFLDQRFKTEDGSGKRIFPPSMRIALFFLGNGWRFNVVSADNYKAALANDIWNRLLELLGNESSPYADQIRESLEGIDLTQNPEELHGVPHEKAPVAVGLLKPEAKVDKDADKGAPLCSILGWTTRVDGTREIPWFAMYSTAVPGPPSPYGPSAANAEKSVKLSFGKPGASSSTSAGPPVPWYDALPLSPSVDWKDAAPKFPGTLESPFELDPNLNLTRGALKRECIRTERAGWFVKGPYEVLLESLFRKKLRTMGG